MDQRITQIFVSHSQYDKDIRASFATVFACAGVKSVYMEFERSIPAAAWRRIREQLNASEAVFLLLGQNIKNSIYTQNWIAFEVGLACAYGKDVWVFEQDGAFIEFPIPYLTDYMLYNLEDRSHFDYVRGILEGYRNPIRVLPLGVDERVKRNMPRGIGVQCAHKNCGSYYFLHNNLLSWTFRCPSCRQEVKI